MKPEIQEWRVNSRVRLKAKGEILAFFPQLGIPILYEDIPILFQKRQNLTPFYDE